MAEEGDFMGFMKGTGGRVVGAVGVFALASMIFGPLIGGLLALLGAFLPEVLGAFTGNGKGPDGTVQPPNMARINATNTPSFGLSKEGDRHVSDNIPAVAADGRSVNYQLVGTLDATNPNAKKFNVTHYRFLKDGQPVEMEVPQNQKGTLALDANNEVLTNNPNVQNYLNGIASNVAQQTALNTAPVTGVSGAKDIRIIAAPINPTAPPAEQMWVSDSIAKEAISGGQKKDFSYRLVGRKTNHTTFEVTGFQIIRNEDTTGQFSETQTLTPEYQMKLKLDGTGKVKAEDAAQQKKLDEIAQSAGTMVFPQQVPTVGSAEGVTHAAFLGSAGSNNASAQDIQNPNSFAVTTTGINTEINTESEWIRVALEKGGKQSKENLKLDGKIVNVGVGNKKFVVTSVRLRDPKGGHVDAPVSLLPAEGFNISADGKTIEMNDPNAKVLFNKIVKEATGNNSSAHFAPTREKKEIGEVKTVQIHGEAGEKFDSSIPNTGVSTSTSNVGFGPIDSAGHTSTNWIKATISGATLRDIGGLAFEGQVNTATKKFVATKLTLRDKEGNLRSVDLPGDAASRTLDTTDNGKRLKLSAENKQKMGELIKKGMNSTEGKPLFLAGNTASPANVDPDMINHLGNPGGPNRPPTEPGMVVG